MQAGEYGIDLEIETGYDLAQGTAGRLRIAQPSGRVVEQALLPPFTGTKLFYTTEVGDFPECGPYRLQARVTFGTDQELITVEQDLYVGPSI